MPRGGDALLADVCCDDVVVVVVVADVAVAVLAVPTIRARSDCESFRVVLRPALLLVVAVLRRRTAVWAAAPVEQPLRRQPRCSADCDDGDGDTDSVWRSERLGCARNIGRLGRKDTRVTRWKEKGTETKDMFVRELPNDGSLIEEWMFERGLGIVD